MGTTERSITVNGDGKVTVRPDTASLSLGVQATGRTATDALSQANISAAALIVALKAAGVLDDDIATSGLSIYPQYNPTGVAVTGYQASNNVTVTVRQIAGTGRGESQCDRQRQEASWRIRCRRRCRRRRCHHDQRGHDRHPAPLFARSAFKSVSDSPAPTPIETGTQDLTASVTVVYEIT